jgi:hypothetical protein
MQATYVGSQYNEWEMEGRKGVYTDVFLVKNFRSDERNCEGQKAVKERVRSDIRKKLKDIVPGQLVEISYDVGPGDKAVLASIEAA